MASRLLNVARSQLGQFRRYASVEGSSAQAGDHGGGSRTWKILSFVVALPGVGMCYINAQIKEAEHHTHARPDFVQYDHLRLRNKSFPWGDGNHSLFHHKYYNALPEGYEDEE